MAERTESAPEYRPTATVSSLKSEDSTEQLICKTPQVKKQSVKSEEVENRSTRRRLVVLLGLAQVVLGALLVGGGAVGVVKGAALARVGAGLWAGCVAVVTGVVGVLAGINDCYGLNGGANGGPLLTAFLALSLLGLACGNSVAVLSATGLQRDTARAAPLPVHTDSFQDEMQAWSPVLANIALLIISSAHCLVCIVSIYQVSKRVCPCLRPKQAYDHNQFDPAFKPYVIHVDEKRREENELCKELEGKLQPEKRKEEPGSFGSATSKERLVSRWLGQAPRKPPPRAPPVLLLPARQASTLGRVPACVVVPPRYATLPLPPAFPVPHPRHPAHVGHVGHPPIYYPVHDARVRRRRSPRAGDRRRREGRAPRARDSQLTRSLERIHRKRRADRGLTDAELKRTYTGLDRAYAEQFIAVCDESRHNAEQHDSLATTSATSDTSHTSHTS